MRRVRSPVPDTPEADGRRCEHPGCEGAGLFRAPKTRKLAEYWWFCLDHVRAYNASWDYYAGMEAGDIERHVREDVTWHRPTWPLGQRGARINGARFHDGFGFFADDPAPDREADREKRRRASSAEEQALAVLDLDFPVTFGEVKARYKELVKRHHPDANGGDKAAEERLKVINEAYATLRSCLAAT